MIDYNNNEVDYGEEVGLSISLKNVGNKLGKNLKVTLASDSKYVEEIIDGEKFIDVIQIGETIEIDTLFIVKFISEIKNNTSVPFKIIIEDDTQNEIFESSFNIVVNAPILELSYEIVGGELKPGTTGSITYTITNKGKVAAKQFMASLVGKSDMDFTIIDAAGYSTRR